MLLITFRPDGYEIANQLTVSTHAAANKTLVRAQLPDPDKFPCGTGSYLPETSSGYISADGRTASLPGQGPSSVIAIPLLVTPSDGVDACLIGVLEFIKNCDEDANTVDTFNLEDEEIVESNAPPPLGLMSTCVLHNCIVMLKL